METINLVSLSRTFEAWTNCKKSFAAVGTHAEWIEKHADKINEMLKALPHGSGLDAGVEFDWSKSTPQKLVFQTSFHHMDDNGYYDGWTDHTLTVVPEFGGFTLKISGTNKRDIKEYLSSMFYDLFTVAEASHVNG